MPAPSHAQSTQENRHDRAWQRRCAIIATLLLTSIFFPRAAFAYRPFDGTDADVAKTGEFELELGPVHYYRQDGASYVFAPATVLNLGIFPGAELVIDSRNLIPNQQRAGRARFQLNNQDVLMKLVLRKGSLQDAHGISAAVEAGVLVPDLHGDAGFGASANLILSQQWKPLTLHWNNQLSDTRTHDADYLSSLICVGGASSWPVRPVAEIFAQRTFGKSTTLSALVGAIWYANRKIDLDLALREASIDSQSVTEVRIGFTWRIDIWGEPEAHHDQNNRDPK